MIRIPAKKIHNSTSHEDLEKLHMKLTKTHDKIKDDQEDIKKTIDNLISIFRDAAKGSDIGKKLDKIIDQNDKILIALNRPYVKTAIGTANAERENALKEANDSKMHEVKQSEQTSPSNSIPDLDNLNIPKIDAPLPGAMPQSNTIPVEQKKEEKKGFEFPDYNSFLNKNTPSAPDAPGDANGRNFPSASPQVDIPNPKLPNVPEKAQEATNTGIPNMPAMPSQPPQMSNPSPSAQGPMQAPAQTPAAEPLPGNINPMNPSTPPGPNPVPQPNIPAMPEFNPSAPTPGPTSQPITPPQNNNGVMPPPVIGDKKDDGKGKSILGGLIKLKK